jgi:hypothetical protein
MNPKKTVKVLYLYMTLPLLLVAAVLWVTTSFSVDEERSAEEPAAAKSVSQPICDDDMGCGIGESCIDGECINPLLVVTEHRVPDPEPSSGISPAGWAAIITSIMGGLTGLLGAITQTVLAFLAVRRRRRSCD